MTLVGVLVRSVVGEMQGDGSLGPHAVSGLQVDVPSRS